MEQGKRPSIDWVDRPSRPESLREHNLGVLLQLLKRTGPIARIRLASLTGISPSTITKLTAELIEAGILCETDPHETGAIASRRAGRPTVPLDFTSKGRVAFAVHLSADGFQTAVVDLRREILASRTVPFSQNSLEAIIRGLAAGLQELHRVVGAETHAIGIGVITEGSVDYTHGILRSHPRLDWRDVPVRDLLEEATGLPCEFDGIGRASAITSWRSSMEDRAPVLHIWVGDTVTCTLLSGGEVLRGWDGRAGELFHWPLPDVLGPVCECGRVDCFSQVAGNAGLLRLARARHLLEESADFAELINQDEQQRAPQLRQLLLERVGWIAQFVTAVTGLLGPATVTVSGPAAEWCDWEAELRRAVAPEPARGRLRTDVTPRSVTEMAAELLLNSYLTNPIRFEPQLRRTIRRSPPG